MALCSQCSGEFACGANDPASRCWCFLLPPLPLIRVDKSCLCPSCFDKEARRQGTRRTLRLLISYLGTAFSGFQEQEHARTVEGELKRALTAITHQSVKLTIAGRTDAGVHGRGQVASLSLVTRLTPKQLMLALAAKLPHDMAVWRIDEVPENFDARRQSVGKRYVYRVFQGLVADPLFRSTTYFVRQDLDVAAMERAAALFVGEHDFSSFRASLCTAPHARRYIWHVGVFKNGPLIEIDIRGNAFCMNMVRIIAGTLVEVGRHKRTFASIQEALNVPDRRQAGPTAPAHGLTLEEIYYPDNLPHAQIPSDAQFPRFPVTPETWPFATSDITIGPV